jgi:uncharacterized protein (DUF305 family)
VSYSKRRRNPVLFHGMSQMTPFESFHVEWFKDQELVKLCDAIARTQREEIRQMEAILARLERQQ